MHRGAGRGPTVLRVRLGPVPALGVLRALLRTGASLSSLSQQERGFLALAQGCTTPVISPSASLRFSVEFQRFLIALSVLQAALQDAKGCMQDHCEPVVSRVFLIESRPVLA